MRRRETRRNKVESLFSTNGCTTSRDESWNREQETKAGSNRGLPHKELLREKRRHDLQPWQRAQSSVQRLILSKRTPPHANLIIPGALSHERAACHGLLCSTTGGQATLPAEEQSTTWGAGNPHRWEKVRRAGCVCTSTRTYRHTTSHAAVVIGRLVLIHGKQVRCAWGAKYWAWHSVVDVDWVPESQASLGG